MKVSFAACISEIREVSVGADSYRRSELYLMFRTRRRRQYFKRLHTPIDISRYVIKEQF